MGATPQAKRVSLRTNTPRDKIRLTKAALHYDRDLHYRPCTKLKRPAGLVNLAPTPSLNVPASQDTPRRQTKMASTEGPAAPEPTAPQEVLYCQGDPDCRVHSSICTDLTPPTVCSFPVEYCEFGSSLTRCKEWLQKEDQALYDRFYSEGACRLARLDLRVPGRARC